MQEFSCQNDGTVEEFRERVGSFNEVALKFDNPAIYVAMAAALWFSIEKYEEDVQKDIPEDDIDGRLRLHLLVHDMQEALEQMFEGVGMKLTDLPMSCSSESIQKLRERVEGGPSIEQVKNFLEGLKATLMEMDKDAEVEVVLISPDGVEKLDDNPKS